MVSPYGSLSLRTNVLSPVASSEAVRAITFCPAASLTAQRLIDATASAARTGLPSCHLSPSRRVKV